MKELRSLPSPPQIDALKIRGGGSARVERTARDAAGRRRTTPARVAISRPRWGRWLVSTGSTRCGSSKRRPTRHSRLTRRLRTHVTVAFGAPLTVALLGPTQLFRDAEQIDDPHWRRRRVHELLAFVAHHGTTTRDKVLGALWPELSDDSARRNLRVTLTYLQSVLEPERARDEPPFYLRLDQDVLTLVGPPHLRLDFRTFHDLVGRADAAAAAGDLDAASDGYDAALALWRGDYLEIHDSEWAGLAAENARSVAISAFVARRQRRTRRRAQ